VVVEAVEADTAVTRVEVIGSIGTAEGATTTASASTRNLPEAKAESRSSTQTGSEHALISVQLPMLSA